MTQDEALAIMKTGASVFLTGEPGSGKTHTVNRYVAYLRESGIEPAITASTGIAATHIQGMTVHRWSGIRVLEALSPEDLNNIAANQQVVACVSGAHIQRAGCRWWTTCAGGSDALPRRLAASR